ncbi:MAG: transketolase [Abyssibacter sp.]|uniref:transketolase n=1 Tax=Abyssibacter sp. TaxID=2320200 RepID=UPI0032191AD0
MADSTSPRLRANAIRALAMDAVQAANSGHPGMPMGMADIAEVLWRDVLKHNPNNPAWADRDRFVLSNGHGSMLLYAVLHLTGYDLGIDDLKAFRQLHSRTPGHPEYAETPGVETTTGPLGQGIANGVGMALAERLLAAEFNLDGHDIVDHYTYVFLGDGCLMEGISHEVCSLAGTLGLGKLIAMYDDNGISIDGSVDGWFRDDTPARFESYGWHVIRNVDGHDAEAVRAALAKAQAETGKPTLICCKTIIGFGATNAGSADTHGAPLGGDGITAARSTLGWDGEAFEIPEVVRKAWDRREQGAAAEAAWNERLAAYRAAHPDKAAEFERRMAGDLPADLVDKLARLVEDVQANGKKNATRKASQAVLNAIAPGMPELLGGSADLTGSNGTIWKGVEPVTPETVKGQYVNYGVREFGMTAMGNGARLHGGFLPFSGTFLTFSDYARNAVRLAALMRIQNILVYTHDSIGLGEDGPTHQPIEHIASLRLMPNLDVWRPCDDVETAVAWESALLRQDGPTALALTRQNVEHQPRTAEQLADVRRGAYTLWEPDAEPVAVVIATGSEVELAVAAAQALSAEGAPTRVVSMPCEEVFLRQTPEYQQRVLPAAVTTRVAIEAGSTGTWWRWVGATGAVIGIDSFGVSAPAGDAYQHFDLTTDRITNTVRDLLN